MENDRRDVFKASHMRQAEIGQSNDATDATAHSAQVGHGSQLRVHSCNADPLGGCDPITSVMVPTRFWS